MTDSLSGIIVTNTFTINVAVSAPTSITINTKPADTTYNIGATTITLSVPTYTWIPSQAVPTWTRSKTAGPAFVTISGTSI